MTAEARERFGVERESRRKMKLNKSSLREEDKDVEVVVVREAKVVMEEEKTRNVEEMDRIRGELDLARNEMEKWNHMMEEGIDEKRRTLTSSKRFALKKLLARARAKCIRLERQLK